LLSAFGIAGFERYCGAQGSHGGNVRKITLVLTVSALAISGCSDQVSEPETESSVVLDSKTENNISDWSMQFTREELMNQALSKSHEYFAKNDQGTDATINYFFEDSVVDARRERVKALATMTMGIFSDYVYSQQNIVAGTTQNFMTSVVIDNDLTIPPQANQGTHSLCGIEVWEDLASGCNWDNSSWLGFGEVPHQEMHTVDSVTPHELFHSAQSNLAKGTFALNFVPVWLVEGSAEFMGYSLLDYAGYYPYENLAQEDWHYLPNPATGLSFWQTQPSASGLPPEWYSMGQIATEYLILNTDIDSLLSIFTYVGEGLEFHEAFEKAIGLELIKFYIIFDIAYENMLEEDTGDFRTFENRLCPEKYEWNCDIDNYRNLEWWQLYPVLVPLPEEAENSDHGHKTHQHRVTPQLDACEDLNNFGGSYPMGVSFEAVERAGIDAHVSTQWYVKQFKLDTNLDGIVCGPGDEPRL